MTNATEMIFGTMDSDKSVAVELKHDDKLPVESNTYIQVKKIFELICQSHHFRAGSVTLHKHLWSTSFTCSYIGTHCDFIVYITLSSL